MDAGGTAHLGHAADGFLHLFRRHQHQIGQLVDDHYHAGQGLHALGGPGQTVELLQLLDAVFREGLVPLHHLEHRPLEGAGGLFRVRHHRDEQVGDAVVGSQLHHLRVHHDEADLVGGGFIQQGDNEGVGADGLTGAGGAGNENVGQLFNVADDVPAGDVPAQGKGRLGLVLGEVPGLDDVPDEDGGDMLVGHLDAHHGNFVGDGSDADAGGAQRQGNVVRQVRDLAELHTLIQHELVPGDGGTVDHVAGGGIHAEAGEGLRQAAGVVPQLSAGLGEILTPAGPQERNGRELVNILLRRQLLLNFRRDCGGLGRHLFRGVGLLLSGGHRLLRQGNGSWRGRGSRRGGRCGRGCGGSSRLAALGDGGRFFGLLVQHLRGRLLLV